MNLKNWENILYEFAKATGDPGMILEYLKYAHINEKIRVRESEIKEAQTEVYNKDDGGGLTSF